jgi:asparagine synthase (glutamine-hydrolysing)
MCGISGIINRNNTAVTKCDIKSMNDLISHRGPDDEGFYCGSNFAFGHRRLSILDLSKNGHQPMHYLDKYTIVFNGEIYNYLELKSELIKHGYTFKSSTDTEVILASYDRWGEACVSKFNGMWSFAIYDHAMDIIFCSRDRFGIKPFYYAEIDGKLVFGSEIRQILPFQKNTLPNISVVKEFLLSGIVEPYTQTFFMGVYKLPGSHNLIYDLSSHQFKINKYYSLNKSICKEHTDIEKSIKDYGKKLERSIEIRLRSDVPVGTCLSGGIDSSTVATIAAKIYKLKETHQFQAITAVSETKDNDESPYAKTVAAASAIKWHTVKPSCEDFTEHLPTIVRIQEEPFASPSIVMQYFVMETAKRENIPVLLDGQGGDETLLGYERYYVAFLIYVFKKKGFFSALTAFRKACKNNSKMSIVVLLKYILYFSSARIRHWNYRTRNKYLLKIPKIPATLLDSTKAMKDIIDLQKREIVFDNLPALLRYEDKNSMSQSIETRLPFLDYHCVEQALSTPPEYKIYNGWTKYILRKFMSRKMPDSIVWRKNKLGFEAPNKLWISGISHEMKKQISSSNLIKSISDMNKLTRNYSKLNDPTKWRLYILALWEQEFLDDVKQRTC